MGSRAALLLGACLLSACGQESRRSSVLLITLDTTRADRIGAYGRDSAGTDHIDALAARGVFFERAITPVPITLPAHTSLMTGSLPVFHGVRDNGLFMVDPGLDTLAEVFGSEGFRTAAFISALPLEADFGLDQGFEVYDQMRPAPGDMVGMHDRRGDQTTDRALDWLADLDSDEDFFLWVHLFDPHFPYAAPDEFAQAHADAYQAEIAFADGQVGRLLEQLGSDGRLGATVIAVTADHGESLGEHGEDTHGHLVFDSTQRVPMVLAGPSVPKTGRVKGAVGLMDLAPTLLDLVGLGGMDEHGARSLMAAMAAGQAASEAVYVETVLPRLHTGWSELYGVELDGWRYVWAPGADAGELYELARDEALDVAAGNPERVVQMAALLERVQSEASVGAFEGRIGELESGDVIAGLEGLGYVGIDLEAEVTGGVGLDPRRVMGARTAAERARQAVERGDFAQARLELDGIRALDPKGVLMAEFEGILAMGEERFEDARAGFQRAVDLAPGRRGLWVQLAMSQSALAQYDAALANCRHALSMAPATQRIQSLEAFLLSKTGE